MRPSCRECWDPVDRDGEDLCDWCAMSPAQRQARVERSWIIFAAFVVAFLALLLVTACGGGDEPPACPVVTPANVDQMTGDLPPGHPCTQDRQP